MLDLSNLKFPIYTLRTLDQRSPVLLNARIALLMPLFTSEENIRLYRQREDFNCVMISLHNASDLRDYITDPPRVSQHPLDFKIVYDPIDNNIGSYIIGSREEFIEALKTLE